MVEKWGLIVISVVVAVLVNWAVKLVNTFWIRPKKLEKFLRDQGLDGTPYRPFLGDLKDFVRITKEEHVRSIQLSDDLPTYLLPYYTQIISKYGPNSFMWFGPHPRLNITDPGFIKEILSNFDEIERGLTGSNKVLGGGILSLEDQQWAKRRKILNPAFHMEKLKNMIPAVGLSCMDMMSKWEAMVSGSDEGWSEIDVWPHIQDLTGDVISRAAFGGSYEEVQRIFHLHKEKLKLSLQLLQTYIPGWSYLPTKANIKMKAISSEMQSILRGVIEKRQKAMKSGEVSGDDLLGIMMESNSRFIKEEGNENAGMSIEEVIEECGLFYFVGSETTACLLVWTMVLLGHHPDWQARAREEVFAVFGKSEPTYEGLPHLKTVTMILNEVLRMYTPAPITFRRTKQTLKLGNLTIPKGVYLTLILGLLHYDSKIWGDDAGEFKPERFSEGVSNAAKVQSSFVPFGSGPRICIGQNFSMIEDKMALAMILQRFSFQLSPSYSHSPVLNVTTTPQYGAPLIMRRL